jgi:hypothetical protein
MMSPKITKLQNGISCSHLLRSRRETFFREATNFIALRHKNKQLKKLLHKTRSK